MEEDYINLLFQNMINTNIVKKKKRDKVPNPYNTEALHKAVYSHKKNQFNQFLAEKTFSINDSAHNGDTLLHALERVVRIILLEIKVVC